MSPTAGSGFAVTLARSRNSGHTPVTASRLLQRVARQQQWDTRERDLPLRAEQPGDRHALVNRELDVAGVGDR